MDESAARRRTAVSNKIGLDETGRNPLKYEQGCCVGERFLRSDRAAGRFANERNQSLRSIVAALIDNNLERVSGASTHFSWIVSRDSRDG
jgi:hypothetical protein